MSDDTRPTDPQARIADLITARTATSAGDWVDLADAPEIWGDLQLLAALDLDDDLAHRAWDPALMRRIVVKLLPAAAPRAEAAAAYLAHARDLATVNHPHLVRIFGAETHEGRGGLRLELIEGVDLAQLVRRGGPLPGGDVVAIARDIGGALAAIHAAGFVHGSVSARAIRTRPDGSLVLMEPSLGTPSAPVRPVVPRGFLAPEVLAGDDPGAAADVFGLGATLLFALCGQTPDEAEGVDLVALRPDAPPALLAAVLAAVAGDRAARPAAATIANAATT